MTTFTFQIIAYAYVFSHLFTAKASVVLVTLYMVALTVMPTVLVDLLQVVVAEHGVHFKVIGAIFQSMQSLNICVFGVFFSLLQNSWFCRRLFDMVLGCLFAAMGFGAGSFSDQ